MKLLHLQHAGEGGDAEKGGSVRNFFSLHRHKNNKHHHQHDDGGADVFDVDFT